MVRGLDRFDLEEIRRELRAAVAESQVEQLLRRLDQLSLETYLDGLEHANPLEFGEPPGEGAAVEDLGPFRIYPSDSSGSGSGSGAGIDIGEGYVQVGGFTIWVEGREDFPTARHEIVAVDVVIDAYGHPSGELVEFDDIPALQAQQDDLDHVYIPIYKFDWGDDSSGSGDGSSGSGDGGDGGPTLVMDLRRMPMTGALETFLDEGESGGGGGEEENEL